MGDFKDEKQISQGSGIKNFDIVSNASQALAKLALPRKRRLPLLLSPFCAAVLRSKKTLTPLKSP